MNQIPTAEEVLIQACKDAGFPEDIISFKINLNSTNVFTEAIKHYTAMHVEAALQRAAEKAKVEEPLKMTVRMCNANVSTRDYVFFNVDKESIFKAYPVENIK